MSKWLKQNGALAALLLTLLLVFLWKSELATLAAGIALFVMGIGRLEEGFRAFSGGALERWLGWSTNRLWKSIVVGTISTAMVQSSTLVTLLSIAFLSAGLINTLGGIGIVFGANLGTTTGAWLIALVGFKLDLAQISMPMLVFGVLLSRREDNNWRGLGLVLLGIGLLFFGIDLMKAGFSSFEGVFDLNQYAVSGWLGVFLYVFVGILATVIMQSSHATLVLTLAALASGQMGYENALAVIIGANLGSTATAIFAAIGSNNAGRRMAATHVLFNIITAAVGLLALHQLMGAVNWTADLLGIAYDSFTIKLAIFHTLYNVMGLLLMLPWVPLMVKYLERWLPQSPPEAAPAVIDQPRTQALYINDTALLHADTALKVLDQELQHLAGLSRQVVCLSVYLPTEILQGVSTEALHQQVRLPVPITQREDADELYERHIKGVYADIVQFISHLDVSLLPEQQQALMNLNLAARDLVEAVKAAKHLQTNLNRYIGDEQSPLRDAYDRLREQCGLNLIDLEQLSEADKTPQVLVELFTAYEQQEKHFADQLQSQLQNQLRSHEIDGWQATSLLNDLHYMMRIGQHLRQAHAALYGEQLALELPETNLETTF